MALIFGEGFSFSGFERNGLFLNLGGTRFLDISGVSGADSILDGRSVVLADFDNDGDYDLFVTNLQEEAHLLYRNNLGQEKGFIRLTVEGTTSGTDAFGTTVRLKSSQGIQTRIVSGGSGFLAQHDPRLIFGMGDDSHAEWLEIIWPTGKIQRVESIARGSSLKVIENSDQTQMLADRSFRLPDPLLEDESHWRKLAIQKGKPFPPLQLEALDGISAGGSPGLEKGKSHFFNLWATWCGPCRREMPELQKLKPTFEDHGIELVGISVDLDAEPETVRRFAEKLGVSYPLYSVDSSEFDKIYRDGELFVPLSILVDEQGLVVDVFASWNDRTEHRLRNLLGRPPITAGSGR